MPPITADPSTTLSSAPAVAWSVHVLAPYALIKDIDKKKDDIDNDPSYFVGTLDDGQAMATEWTPELRLGIKRALDTLPNVARQSWHYIGLDSIDRILDEIQQDHQTNITAAAAATTTSATPGTTTTTTLKTVVLNFIDGMEEDHCWPGISVIQGLEKRAIAFTGADSTLYLLDSDKALIKRHLVDSGTPTPGYYDVYSRATTNTLSRVSGQHGHDGKEDHEEDSTQEKGQILEGLSRLRFPLLVKPANSSSSRGISTKSVVDTPEEAYERAMETKKVWGPVYVEEYISGREYTVLVSGSSQTQIKVYKVLERVFRSEIPERERMLTHEMKWGENNYGSDETVKDASWWMRVCPEEDQPRLQNKAKEMYASFGGNGYCRMDLREDHRTGDLFVVDVNANCSIDEDEDCAMGKILKASGLTLGQFFAVLMDDAIQIRDNLLLNPPSSTSTTATTTAATKGAKRSIPSSPTATREQKSAKVSA